MDITQHTKHVKTTSMPKRSPLQKNLPLCAKKSAVCLMALLLQSCAPAGKSDCLIFQPVYIDSKDQITDPTARQILYNNESGRELCGWEYTKGK